MKKNIFKRKKKDVTPVNCNVVYSGLANYYTGFVTAGGNLILTDTELVFDGHRFNVGRRKAFISVKDISNVQLTKKFNYLQHMLITAKDETYKFTVYHGDEWVKQIEKVRKKNSY